MSRRLARRERNREDFIRATQQAVPSKYKAQAGQTAGPTIKESIEDEIRKAVRVHNRLENQCIDAPEDADLWSSTGLEHKRKAARGVVRGLCKALLIYEAPYSKDDKNALLKLEKEFLNEGKE